MTPVFSSDGAARINWNFRTDENNVPFTMTFKDSAGAAYSFVYDDFQVIIKKNKGDKKKLLVMGFGSGLSLSSNVLTIDLNRVRAKLTPGEYYWYLYKNDYGRVWIDGIATGYDGLLPVIEETTSVTINDGGTDITVTISEATPNIIQQGGGGGTWGSITGTLSAQTDLQSALDAKQAALVSGTNIKTVNGNSLVGSGDVTINAGVWGNITGTLSSQTDLQSALDAKAPLASPTFTGTPAAPTAAANTNTTQIATTAYVQTELNDKADSLVTSRTLTASHTLDATDLASVNSGKDLVIVMDVASANDLTIPLNATQAFATGTIIGIRQKGAGQTTIVATGGVTLNAPLNAFKLAAQNAIAFLEKTGTDEWYLNGETVI